MEQVNINIVFNKMEWQDLLVKVFMLVKLIYTSWDR